MDKLWFLCPHCNKLTSLDSWGEYPYSWQVILCPHCGMFYDPVENQVIPNENKGRPASITFLEKL